MAPLSANTRPKPKTLAYESIGHGGFLARPANRWIAAALLVALILSAGEFVYMRFFFTIKLFPPARAISPVTETQWRKVSVGMTKAEVITLLGPSQSHWGGDPITVNGRVFPSGEFWEYNWTNGIPAFGPSPKTYVVYFDANGRVVRWRKAITIPAGVP